MPRRPERAIALVTRFFADERLVELRPVLGEHLKSLDCSSLEAADRNYFEATMHELLGEKELAVQALRRAVEIVPSQIGWRFELARLLAQTGDIGEARKHVRICLQLAPQNKAYAQFLLGIDREPATRSN